MSTMEALFAWRGVDLDNLPKRDMSGIQLDLSMSNRLLSRWFVGGLSMNQHVYAKILKIWADRQTHKASYLKRILLSRTF